MSYGSPIAGTKQQMWSIGETYRKEKEERDKEEQFEQETQKQIIGNVWDIYQKTQAEDTQKLLKSGDYEYDPAYEKSSFLAKPFVSAKGKTRMKAGVPGWLTDRGYHKKPGAKAWFQRLTGGEGGVYSPEEMTKKEGEVQHWENILRKREAAGVKGVSSVIEKGEGGEEIGLGEGSDVLGSVGKGINIAGDVSEVSSSWKKNIEEGKGAKNVQNIAAMAKYLPHPAFKAIGWAADISKLFT